MTDYQSTDPGRTENTPERSIPERFEAFHAANPGVYDILVREARRWLRETGRDKVGIELLYSRARWLLAMRTTGDAYKLNDHFTAYYSRLIMAQEPDLIGIFDIRRSAVADSWIRGYLRNEAA